MDERDIDIINNISSMIRSCKAFSILRSRIENKILLNRKLIDTKTYYNSGIYPVGCNVAISDYINQTIKAIKNCNVFLHHKVNPIKIHNSLISKYNPKVSVGSHAVLFNVMKNNVFRQSLKGKKILIISSFKKSIDMQYSKGNSILPEHKKLITYGCVQSIANNKIHSSWTESLNIMKKDISKLDFDIAFLSCGSYGDALCDHVKEMNKQSIYIGGSLQNWFYICGKRFHSEAGGRWKKCEPEEMPEGYQKVEKGCYW